MCFWIQLARRSSIFPVKMLTEPVKDTSRESGIFEGSVKRGYSGKETVDYGDTLLFTSFQASQE